jgi:hypothetical protein
MHLRLKAVAWASGDPVWGRCLAREDQLGRCTAEKVNITDLFYSGKVTLAAMYLRRVHALCRNSAAALAQVSTVFSPPAPAAQNPSVERRPPADLHVRNPRKIQSDSEQLSRCNAEQSKYYRIYLHGAISPRPRGDVPPMSSSRVAGRCFVAAMAHVSTAVTPPAPAAYNLGVRLRRPCRGRRVTAC